mmetsp:Transcript_39576/g.113447  ORF Transcript_39576/g.113447 Transcript_39576/m.113447 type:complete len:348 (+) Transcript_39576:722-1765(+)
MGRRDEVLTHGVEDDSVDSVLVALEDAQRLALCETPEIDPRVRGRRCETHGLPLERWCTFARRVPGDAVTPVLVRADRERRLARRHLPELDEARPRGGAEQPAVRRELALRERSLVANLRDLCDHGLLQEAGEPIHPLLVLQRVLHRALASLLDEPLVGPRDGPLRDLHARLEQLLKALSVEEVLVARGLLPLRLHGRRRAAGHDGAEAVPSLVGAFAEDARGLAELAKLGFDLRVVGRHRHLTLGGLLLEGSHGILVLLPGPHHVLRGLIHNVALTRHRHIATPKRGVTASISPENIVVKAAIVDVRLLLRHGFSAAGGSSRRCVRSAPRTPHGPSGRWRRCGGAA